MNTQTEATTDDVERDSLSDLEAINHRDVLFRGIVLDGMNVAMRDGGNPGPKWVDYSSGDSVVALLRDREDRNASIRIAASDAGMGTLLNNNPGYDLIAALIPTEEQLENERRAAIERRREIGEHLKTITNAEVVNDGRGACYQQIRPVPDVLAFLEEAERLVQDGISEHRRQANF